MKSKFTSFTSRWASTCLAMGALCLGVLMAPDASAQFRSESLSITNVVPATSTNAAPMTGIIDTSRVSDFSLGGAVKLQGAGTSAVLYTVQSSLDQSNWVTAFTLSVTAAGTTAVPWITNVNCRAIPYWKISSVGNANATHLTNHFVLVGIKRNVD